jgi:hypothetical protein
MGTRVNKLNTKALEKLMREADLPLPPPPGESDQAKKAYRMTLIAALERRQEVDELNEQLEAGAEELVDEVKMTGPHPTCKNCNRDLIAINDWHVMTPPGFGGTPNEEYIRENSYCSGCAVAANTHMLPKWDVTQIEIS